MAAYPGMMPHMVAAPEDNVVPYLDKGLDGVVLKDKCVFPNVVQGNKARGMRTNIFGQAAVPGGTPFSWPRETLPPAHG